MRALPPLRLGGRPQDGHFALHREERPGVHVLERDRAGVHKLFFGIEPSGRVRVSNFLIELLTGGIPLERIGSVPPGARVRVDEKRQLLEVACPEPWAVGGRSPLEAAAAVRRRLDWIFEGLMRARSGREVYVAFSGGLDSTVVLALTKARWSNVTALTFALEEEDGRLRPSDDLDAATRLARWFGVRHELVTVKPRVLLEGLDEVLVYGQDHRDFNVHCGLVNHALAVALERHGSPDPLLLSGDGMNELMADYSPVEYRGRVCYDLPRLSPSRLRRHLVEGLDAGDREVGIYHARGVRCVQPYLLAAEAYLSVAGQVIDHPRGKQRFAELVWGRSIPRFVYERPKVRAQEGSASHPTGALAAALDAGFDSAALERRFRQLFRLGREEVRRLISRGRYRTLFELPALRDREKGQHHEDAGPHRTLRT